MLYRFVASSERITFLKIRRMQYDLEYIRGTHSLFEVICTDVWFVSISTIWKILIFLQIFVTRIRMYVSFNTL